jgi:hypothetical protein
LFFRCERKAVQLPFDPHKEKFSPFRGTLIGVDNISVVIKNRIGNLGNKPFAILNLDVIL